MYSTLNSVWSVIWFDAMSSFRNRLLSLLSLLIDGGPVLASTLDDRIIHICICFSTIYIFLIHCCYCYRKKPSAVVKSSPSFFAAAFTLRLNNVNSSLPQLHYLLTFCISCLTASVSTLFSVLLFLIFSVYLKRKILGDIKNNLEYLNWYTSFLQIKQIQLCLENCLA